MQGLIVNPIGYPSVKGLMYYDKNINDKFLTLHDFFCRALVITLHFK